jgi:hypothetical protein
MPARRVVRYAVIAIPETGLFARNEMVVTGHDTEMEVEGLVLYVRRSEAEEFADQERERWANHDLEHTWSFPILRVLVDERS